MNKDVALVLSSGGPRGFAYIGAIEELESRGYNITSVAGCSIGSTCEIWNIKNGEKCLPHICTTTAKRRSHRLKKPDTALLQY